MADRWLRPMRVLPDHGVPAPLIAFFGGHEVTKAKDAGWDRLTNGELLAVAEAARFDVFVTTDKNLRYQQSLEGRRIAVVILGKQQWPDVRPCVERVVEGVDGRDERCFGDVRFSFREAVGWWWEVGGTSSSEAHRRDRRSPFDS